MGPAVAEVPARDGLPRALVVHEGPGRLRLRIPARRGQARWFEELERRLPGGGILAVRSNPAAASVVIHHRLDRAMIAGNAREAGLFEIVGDVPARPRTAIDTAGRRLGWLDERLRRVTGGGVDAASLAFMVLMSMGMRELLRGNISAPAVTLFWYAASTAVLAHNAATQRAFAEAFLQGESE